MDPVYASIAWSCKAAIRAMGWRVSVSGAQHIPAVGPAVLASNHIGYLDPVMLGYAADRRGRAVRFLATRDLWHYFGFGVLLDHLRQVPVERGADRGRSLRAALRLLGDGEIIGVFPESAVTVSFVPAQGHRGAARMVLASGAPLIPVGIWGTQRIFTSHRRPNLQRGVAMTVEVGRPVPYGSGDDPDELTRRLMDRIRALVTALVAGYPQQPAGPDDRWWLPRYAGGSAPSVEEAARLRCHDPARRRRGRSRTER